ncbi:hypothetical protein BDF19DRAFT_435832 [Syncephalis fuscata]|nr:hypothetical protein BDF19DRAFT_435832 [Syncephalis fuscata]
MTRLLSTTCCLPAKILWKVAFYLDDESLLPFLTAFYNIFSAAEEKDIDWKRWFYSRFYNGTETRDWIEWHNNVLEKKKKNVSDYSIANLQNNSNWLKHYIAQFSLAKNWQYGISNCTTLSILDASGYDDLQITTRILDSNIWGTLILTNTNTLYFAAHWPTPKLLLISDLSANFSQQTHSLIKGMLNRKFIVITGPGRSASSNNTDVAKDFMFYWDFTQPSQIEKKELLYNQGATEIVDLHDQWLLLKEPVVSTESYSINVLNLEQNIPIPVKTEAAWNTYSIINTTKTTCQVYAGTLCVGTQFGSASHSWDILQSSILDVRTINEQRHVSIPLETSKYSARQSRFLTESFIMVWQVALSMKTNHTENNALLNTTNNSNASGIRKFSFGQSNKSHSAKQKNVFFIHDIYSSYVHYSGTFSNELPTVSIRNNCIVTLDDTNLTLINMETKQTIFNTRVASALIHTGYVLNQFWIAQHPSGGFYTVNLDNTSEFGWIAAEDTSGEVRVNMNTLVKVSNKDIAIWTMNKLV